MRKVLAFTVLCLLIMGCDTYKGEIRYLNEQVEALNEQLDAFEQSVASIRKIASAIEQNDYLTGVAQITNDIKGDGYKLIFKNHGTIAIYFGKDGKNGKDGIDGVDGHNAKTPILGVKQHYDGNWYWTLDGNWVYDSDYNMVRVNGTDNTETIKLKIEGEYWYISYDGGMNWERAGLAVTNQTTLFKGVDNSNDKYLAITLKNGTILKIPKGEKLNLYLNYPASISAGETVEISYNINAASEQTEVIIVEPQGWKAILNKTQYNRGIITVTAPDPMVKGSILIFASDNGMTEMAVCDFSEPASNLSKDGTANSYIVPRAGTYSFNAGIKGCGPELIDQDISRASILWEQIGSETVTNQGRLIKELHIDNVNDQAIIRFTTADTFQEGNAVIAVRDYNNVILWSWHLWFTSYDPNTTYSTLVGSKDIVMCRNLGASSSVKGSASSLGMLYQWGRKDPFLASSSVYQDNDISKTNPIKASDAQTGTIQYSVNNPTTFLSGSASSPDWLKEYYSGELWSGSKKTIYDPCPPGWQLSNENTWKGLPSSVNGMLDNQSYGITISSAYIKPATWFPFAGMKNYTDGMLSSTGKEGFIWTGDQNGRHAKVLSYSSDGISVDGNAVRADGYSVRCRKSNTDIVSTFEPGNMKDLSEKGTANSYLVPAGGTYRFRADVKGNSKKPIDGKISSAYVLWESFGTSESPKKGSLISSVSYSNGYVTFKVSEPYKKGNAIIAVKDDKGTILWSWHIWLSDFDPRATMTLVGSEYYMDRNLGATENTPGSVGALGLKYQFGRKDPFPGTSTTKDNSTSAATIEFTHVDNSEFYNEKYTVEHPSTLIYAYLHDTPKELFWLHDKNEYDPCPPGWKVMTDENRNTNWFKRDDRHLGYWITQPYAAKDVFFPATGEGNNVGLTGAYYLTMQESSDFYFYFGIPRGIHTNSHVNEPYSVRCVLDSNDEKYGYIEDLCRKERANSYIISKPGSYKIDVRYKGNSNEWLSVSPSNKVEVLWEAAGNNTEIEKGDIIRNLTLKNGYVYFSTPEKLLPGNALIAIKDYNNIVLWSWHIWVTDADIEKTAQEYSNGAGIMMDRNLGAHSSGQGNAESLGMMYQWGRKDPFLPSSSVSTASSMFSTGSWTNTVSTGSSGSDTYAYRNPTTFIVRGGGDGDWLFTSEASPRWGRIKTKNDPCPPGWKVAPGGPRASIWRHAGMDGNNSFNASYHGISFSSSQTGSTSWYPAAGKIDFTGNMVEVGNGGYYWSSTEIENKAYVFSFGHDGKTSSTTAIGKANAAQVRCLKDDGSSFVAIDSITFALPEIQVVVGNSLKLHPNIHPDDASEQNMSWSSSNSTIASISNGTLRANSVGECTITVIADGVKASIKCIVVKEGTNTGLSGIPFMFNFNAKYIDTKHNSIPMEQYAQWKKDLQLNSNDYEVHDNYIHINYGTYAAYDFGSENKNPFNREGHQPLTIIAKVKGDHRNHYSIFSNRGNDYNYMFREDGDRMEHFYLHTREYENAYIYIDKLPNIVAMRVNVQGQVWAESIKDNTKSSIQNINWGNKSNGIAFFSGDIWGGELWSGDFYWIFLSLNELNDEEINRVIKYNEL